MAVAATEAQVWVAPDREEDRFLLEGPRETNALGPLAVMWVNIQTGPDATTGDIFLRLWDGQTGAVRTPGRPGFVFPTDRAGVVLVGCEKTVGTLNVKSGEWKPLTTIPDANPRTIINDGEIVPGGRAIVFGTKDARFADPLAHLYLFRLDDDRVTVLADKQLCSNGKVFVSDANGLILYDIDTPTRVVMRYRLDVSQRSARSDGVAIDLRGEPGYPDGMCDCGDGTVIVAFYNPDPLPAGRAARFRLGSGELLEEWTTPGSPRVTCPLLVNRPDGVKLILTTATEGMPADQRAQCPNAGCLFLADTRFTAIPPTDVVRFR